MSNNSNKQLIYKGVFALALVAALGTTGVVFAVTNENGNQLSGYNADDANKAMDKFDASFKTFTDDFESSTGDNIADTKAALGPNASKIDNFESKFKSESDKYNSAVADAQADFRNSVKDLTDQNVPKDQFIDRFNNLKAEYFNKLDAAKNEFAAAISGFGNEANVAKDQFMNRYNSDRDMYGNKIEQLKNELANTLSNL